MKYLLILFLTTILLAQDDTLIQQLESKGYTVLNEQETEKMLAIIMENEANQLLIAKYEQLDSQRITQINTLTEALNVQTQRLRPAKQESLFEWQFTAGLGTNYVFDSTLINSTIISTLARNLFIFTEIRLKIDRFILSGEAGIPFKDKFYLRAKVGYLIF